MFKVKVVTPQGLYRVLETSILNVRTTGKRMGTRGRLSSGTGERRPTSADF